MLAHQGLAHEDRARAGSRDARHVGRRREPALRDQEGVARRARGEPLEGRDVDSEAAQVAVVDAQQRPVQRQRLVEFRRIVDLGKDVEAEVAGETTKPPAATVSLNWTARTAPVVGSNLILLDPTAEAERSRVEDWLLIAAMRLACTVAAVSAPVKGTATPDAVPLLSNSKVAVVAPCVTTTVSPSINEAPATTVIDPRASTAFLVAEAGVKSHVIGPSSLYEPPARLV